MLLYRFSKNKQIDQSKTTTKSQRAKNIHRLERQVLTFIDLAVGSQTALRIRVSVVIVRNNNNKTMRKEKREKEFISELYYEYK